MPLFPHQIRGAAFAGSRVAAFLAHEQGCGKTATTIASADAMGDKRILVLCPTVARGVWRAEFAKWSTAHHRVTVVYNGRAEIPEDGVVVVGYDLVSRGGPLLEKLKARSWHLLVCDEAHALKDPKSKRTKAVYGHACKGGGLASRATRTVLLSGTPMLAAPHELWSHMRSLVPDRICIPGTDRPMGYQQFIARYCTTRLVRVGSRLIEQVTGANHAMVPELRERLVGFMDRVLKVDVLKDLPPMIWATYPVTEADSTIDATLLAQWREIEAVIQRSLTAGSAEDTLTQLRQDRALAAHVATQRRLTGLVKAGAAVKAIKEDLDGGSAKVVVFAHHTDVIDYLRTGLRDYGVVVIDGRTKPGHDRDLIVANFQSQGEGAPRVFIGQNAAASTAITLTAASSVWLVEPDWTPAINAQAAARCHRIGTKSSVMVRMVSLEGSIDQAITNLLARKSRDITAVIEEEI
jgi:SWI/SNF-related matrix-associated actin-dependent regulator 1 of chromatin subfamily A